MKNLRTLIRLLERYLSYEATRNEDLLELGICWEEAVNALAFLYRLIGIIEEDK